MANGFKYDVFLSHSSKDKAVVRPLVERLRADGLRVWFDEWVIKPGDSIPVKIAAGTFLHSAFFLLPFLSGSLTQFLYINWLPADREREQEGASQANRTPLTSTYCASPSARPCTATTFQNNKSETGDCLCLN